MSWNYRIINHPQNRVLNGEEIDTSYLAIHEVYYNDQGNPTYYRQEPSHFVCDSEDGKEAIIERLKLALGTISKEPILSLDVFDVKTKPTPMVDGMEDVS